MINHCFHNQIYRFQLLHMSNSYLFQGFSHAHPGSPYVFGLVEDDQDLEFPEPMPVVGIVKFHPPISKDLLFLTGP